jgi:hypothetical protein
MSIKALPISLAGGLTDREAIADALYRAVLAIDHADEALLRSAMTEDASTEIPGVVAANGIEELKATVYDRVSKLDTTHFLSNIRVNIESATTAKVSCSAMAQHVRTGQGMNPASIKFTSGALYQCDVVKVDELWKIKYWKAQMVWFDGDRSVMSGE